jgi:hypothetical protein
MAGCQPGVVAILGLGGWDVADRLEQATVVKPVDPREGGELDGLAAAPGSEPVDHLGLEQADHRLGEGVVVAVADEGKRCAETLALGAPSMFARHSSVIARVL